MAQGRNRKSLAKRARKGQRGYPIATVAYYGPNNMRASKVVCGIIQYDGAEAESMKKVPTILKGSHVPSARIGKTVIGLPVRYCIESTT